MKTVVCCCAILYGLLGPAICLSATYYVPTDQPTIQAAIDVSSNGDRVIVLDGVYTGEGNRDINFMGKSIIVRSANGPEFTIIDIEETMHSGFSFYNSNEDINSVIKGFTITGSRAGTGGAIYLVNSSPKIENCVISNNDGTFDFEGFGGAVYCYNSSPLLVECVIEENTYLEEGGGLASYQGSPTILRCKFLNNAVWSEGIGGGVFLSQSNANIIECEFFGNYASHSGGAMYIEGGEPLVKRCIFGSNNMYGSEISTLYLSNSSPDILYSLFYNNSVASDDDDYGGVITLYNSFPLIRNCTVAGNGIAGMWIKDAQSAPVLLYCLFALNESSVLCTNLNGESVFSCCDIFGNTTGDWIDCISGYSGSDNNFSEDPIFCDITSDDYHPSSESPCAPENNECDQLIGALVPGCGWVSIQPETMFAVDAQIVDTAYARIYLSGVFDGYGIDDIDGSTLTINGLMAPQEVNYINATDTTIAKLELLLARQEFVSSYGLLWDTTTRNFEVNGYFADQSEFLAVSSVEFIGHITGDINGDGAITFIDVFGLKEYIYNNGYAPRPAEKGDINSDGKINLVDVLGLIDYLITK